ncbi:MAG TPA: DEAD/DEAH box helicase [Acidimicrobiales bacterium]|nr:DEAD/DEAH box helicase [Acidimicrobiales bacterium]
MADLLAARPTSSWEAWLHPAVCAWFRRRFPDGPTESQSLGWPLIASGRDTLIAAPTGSGKTLAGFLMAINSLYLDHQGGGARPAGVRVVYVSPLKALAVDVAENLDKPLAGIAAAAAEIGLAAPQIRVAVRTGDTTASERSAMLRRPPQLVVTTPESLYLLLTSGPGRQALRTVETVIVDEIHALARDKRGAHLAVSLERLEELCERRPVRVGLSATQRPVEVVGRLLVGDRPLPAIVDVGHRRHMDVALELPPGEMEAVTSAGQMAGVLDRIAELVGEHRTTLVFVNTRRMAERVAHQLAERVDPDGPFDHAVAAHHGSLSKERRLRVESRLRAGELRALVATASLELGIDVGPVDLVCQLGSPRSIATFLQRVGRSNHSRSGTPKGRLFPLTRDELVECTALLWALGEGRLDSVVPPCLPLDIAAQQVVAEVSAREWTTEGLRGLLRRAAPYIGLTDERFDEVTALVSAGVQTGRGRRGAYLHHDAVNGVLRARKGARLAAVTSGGAIPETGDYRVLAEPDDALVGTVNEDWAVESMPGDIFLLGSHSWQIRRVEQGVVRVRDAGDKPPTVPFWLGEAPARTDELSSAVSELRAAVDGHLAAGDAAGARRWLAGLAGADAAEMVVSYLAAGRAALGAIPTQDRLVLERFFDDTGGMQLVLHSPFGARVNRALGLALRKKFCRRFDFELQAAATDDALVLSLGPHHSFPLEEVPAYLSSRSLPETLRQAVLDSPMFQSRWRWNLNRSLLVLRWRGGRRNPPAIQRMEADDLLAAVFPQAAACQDNLTGPREIPDHLLVRQTLDDTLHEAMDLDAAVEVVRRIETGRLAVHSVETTEASVLAHEIVTARPYAFLDDEEFQNRRTNAVQLRRGLSTDLDGIAGLRPEAIEAVHAEIEPTPTCADELHDLLLSTVALRPRPAWEPLFAELIAAGRARAARGMWVAAECEATAAAAGRGEPDAVLRSVRGHLEMAGVTTLDALAEASGLPPPLVEAGLASLRHEGFAFEGRYRPGAAGPEWVARRLLARMHAYSRRSRRSSVDPASAQDFMRFLLGWQHVAPGTQLSGPAGLAEAIDQLQGWEAAAGVWERELIARRMSSYRPDWLDRLCHAGEAAWLRLSPRPVGTAGPSRATPITVVFRADLPWLLEAARPTGERPASSRVDRLEVGGDRRGVDGVLAVLAERGACFAADLVAATRLRPEEVSRALWDGVAAGLVMCDGFEAIRSRLERSRRPARRFGYGARAGALPPSSAGRWTLVPPAGGGAGDRHDLAETVAGQMLRRWGVVFRELAGREGFRLPWREVQWALRRLEDRGLVLGGRFVAGFAGEQYALPEAADGLARARRRVPQGERVAVNATDPLNLVGLVVPGDPVAAVAANRVEYLDGVPI